MPKRQDSSKTIKNGRIVSQDLSASNLKQDLPTIGEIAGRVVEIQKDYQDRRDGAEDGWMRAWLHYLSDPIATSELRRMHFNFTNPEEDGVGIARHNIPTGKAPELVETTVAYLMGATFPDKNWFDAMPTAPIPENQWRSIVDIVKRYMQKKFNDGLLTAHWELFLRQLCIVGTSVMAMPWIKQRGAPITRPTVVQEITPSGSTYKVEDKAVVKDFNGGYDFEVLDMFDVFLDPDQQPIGYKGNIIRRFRKTKGEILAAVEAGIYPFANREDVINLTPNERCTNDNNRQVIHEASGFDDASYWNPDDLMYCYEFWGDLSFPDVEYKDIVATVVGNVLLQFENNYFWDGKPFIIGQFTTITNSPYGRSLLNPVLGQLQHLYETQNQRLDANELIINPMWLVRQDGVLNLEEVYSEAGHYIIVEDMDAIEQLKMESNVQVSVQDEQLLTERIDKTVGLIGTVGMGGARQSERTTAEEIRTQRESGGVRLDKVYAHIEDTVLIPFLKRAYVYCQQFVQEDDVVRVRSRTIPQGFEYITVGQLQLAFDLDFIPQGSAHIIDKEQTLRNIADWLSMVVPIPQLAEQVDWQAVSNMLARKFLKEEWEQFVVDQPAQQELPPVDPTLQEGATVEEQSQSLPSAAALPLDPTAQLADEVAARGGQVAGQAIAQQAATGELQNTLANTRTNIYGAV